MLFNSLELIRLCKNENLSRSNCLIVSLKENDLFFIPLRKNCFWKCKVVEGVNILPHCIYENHFNISSVVPKWGEKSVFDKHVIHGYYCLKAIAPYFLRLKHSLST